jgi:hypothetical protein
MNMVRTINVPYVRVFQPFVDTNGHYVGCRSDLRDMQHQYNDRTGSELVDTGNDNVKLTPKRHEYPNITTDMIEAVRAH